MRAGFNDELRRILVAASDGTFASDTQPLARLNVFVIAKDASGNEGAGATARGTSGGGGSIGLLLFIAPAVLLLAGVGFVVRRRRSIGRGVPSGR